MKVLFAYNLKETDNEYVKRLIELTKNANNIEVTTSLDEFWNSNETYNFVVINWPEYLFDWRINISDLDLDIIKKKFYYFKKLGTKIITIVHDEYSNLGRNINIDNLFDFCYEQSDCLVHLEEYSKNVYELKFPNIKHVIVYHPLFKNFDFFLDYNKCRKKNNIKENEFIVFVPGNIRKKEEFDFCLKIFEKIEHKNKKIYFQRIGFFSKPSYKYELNNYIYFILKKWYYKIFKKVVFFHGFMNNEKLSCFFTSSDLVLIPRIDILNSGNIILGSQFGKLILACSIGNIGVILDKMSHLKIENMLFESSNLTTIDLDRFKKEREMKRKINLFYDDEIIIEQLKKIFNK